MQKLQTNGGGGLKNKVREENLMDGKDLNQARRFVIMQLVAEMRLATTAHDMETIANAMFHVRTTWSNLIEKQDNGPSPEGCVRRALENDDG